MWWRIYYLLPYEFTNGGIGSLEELYNDVHIIAYFYHWGEKEIMSLPILKRRSYRERIAQQVEAENHPDEEDGTEEDY
jgi:hypothetical protein